MALAETLPSEPTSSSTANILLNEEIPLNKATDVDNVTVGIRKPRRVIHFSDGVVEEYSTDEEDGPKKAVQPAVDPKTLNWIPYLWYYAVVATTKAFGACDFMGEKIAYFIGITSPKYQYAINEYNRLDEEERKELDRAQDEMDLHRDKIAKRQADRVYAETTMASAAANPGLGTDI